MAEALTRHLTRGQVNVFSAGSHPASQIHPEAVRAIARLGADLRQYHPKSLELFQGQSFDRVIILQARDEEGEPSWPSPSKVITWDFPDPVASPEPGEAQTNVFQALAAELMIRIRLLLTLIERERREAGQQEPFLAIGKARIGTRSVFGVKLDECGMTSSSRFHPGNLSAWVILRMPNFPL